VFTGQVERQHDFQVLINAYQQPTATGTTLLPFYLVLDLFVSVDPRLQGPDIISGNYGPVGFDPLNFEIDPAHGIRGCFEMFTGHRTSNNGGTGTSSTTTVIPLPTAADCTVAALQAAFDRLGMNGRAVGTPKCVGIWVQETIVNTSNGREVEGSVILKWNGDAWGPPPNDVCSSVDMPPGIPCVS
jgi:hypothetical protein